MTVYKILKKLKREIQIVRYFKENATLIKSPPDKKILGVGVAMCAVFQHCREDDLRPPIL